MEPLDFFQAGNANSAYRHCRDSENAAADRAAIQALWERFLPLLGDDPIHFLRDARVNFTQRLWEMHLACLLVDNGLHLERPPAEAPDIKLLAAGSPIWIEATVPRRGEGPDSVEEPPTGQPYHLDRDRMILRYVASVEAKAKQCEQFIRRGLLGQDAAFIVALNTSMVPDSDIEEHGMPDVVRALLALGRVEYRFAFDSQRGAHGDPQLYWPRRDAVTKASGKSVPLGAFCDDRIANVSAVMFCARRPMQLRAQDIRIIHNPFSSTRVTRGLFPFAREFWFDEQNQLRCTGP